MGSKEVSIARISLGVTAAVGIAYGYQWLLYFITPIFAFIFLAMPTWIGWRMAVQLLLRLAGSLILGVAISEYLLDFPLLCVPVYGILLFFIYYNDTPTAPPMATLFMTLAVTMVPIISFSGAGVAHVVALALLANMGLGLFIAWLFHSIISYRLCSIDVPPSAAKKKPTPALPSENERIRLALVSTMVALSAVILFFALNLAQYVLAMIYICFMAGTPSRNASIQVLKANALATCIGGLAIIISYNLLVAVPTYPFLLALTLCISLLFSRIILSGGDYSQAVSSGFTTFLVLLGSSTGVDHTASGDFYIRIAQVLFAGLFTLAALMVIEHVTRPRKSRLMAILRWMRDVSM